MGGSIHHAEDFYELAGRMYDSEQWEVRHRHLHGAHLPDCSCFEKDDDKRYRCESWLCELCKPGHHNIFIGCSECRTPWPCEPWRATRQAVDLAHQGSRRSPPSIVYPEKESDAA